MVSHDSVLTKVLYTLLTVPIRVIHAPDFIIPDFTTNFNPNICIYDVFLGITFFCLPGQNIILALVAKDTRYVLSLRQDTKADINKSNR
jgi:hypothetical protein